MKIKLITLTILSALLIAPAIAVSGTSFDPSLNPFTARQVGMGGVAVGFADDANAVFNNPSGLADIEFPQLVATSRKLVLDETQYSLIGWAMPTDYGTFGLGYAGLGTGGSLPTMLDPASNRIIIDPSREAMGYDNNVMIFSYANSYKFPRIAKKVKVGGNLKFFNQALSGDVSSKATGMGIDIGASYRASDWITVGASLQNLIEGNMQWDGGDSDKVGGYYKLGLRANILGPKESYREHPQLLYGGFDIDIPHSSLNAMNYHMGVEYFPTKKIALRSGINMEKNGAGFTLGIGLINGGFRFDYAFAQRPGIPGDTPHYFSLSYIGERVVIHRRDKKPKRRESQVKFFRPKDRSITDKDSTVISAEARAIKVIDQTTIFRVTGVSETKEVKEIREIEILNPVYMNGIKLDQVGTIEATSPLNFGRNLFRLIGFVSPEVFPTDKGTPEIFAGSGEVRVLRFDPFKDTPMNHWAIRPIALSVTLGLVKGYPDDTFRPKRGITRAELVTLLVRSLPGVDLQQKIEATPFKDVKADHWAAKFITIGSRKNLITGYPDGTFKPKRVLTRAEGITILARYAGVIGEPQTKPPFPDVKADYWAAKYIKASLDLGLLKYLEGKNLKPGSPFTRAEACEVLYRTPRIQKRVDQFWNTGIISAQQVDVKRRGVKPATTEAAPVTKPATSEAK
jgi:opacity protein-like surface antigen